MPPFFRPLTYICLSLSLIACSGAAPTAAPTVAPTSAPLVDPTPTPAPVPSTEKLSVLCSVAENWCQAMVQAFEARTGIEISYVRLSAGEALTRLRAGKDGPEFDVYFGGPADGYAAAKGEGLLQPYISPSSARIAEQLKDKDGYWTGAYVGVLGFCANKEALARLGVSAPQSWQDVLDPKLKGQVILPHPATSGTAYTAMWTLVTLNDGNQDAAMDYFKQLHTNVTEYTRSGITSGEKAVIGESALTITFAHSCYGAIKEGIPDPVVTFPAEGTGYEIGGLGIMTNAHNVAAAKTFVDFVLSTEGQVVPYTVQWFVMPTNPEAPFAEKSPGQAKLVIYDFVAAGAARDALVKRFETEIAPAPK